LIDAEGGDSPDDPVLLSIDIPLGNMTDPDGGWQQLLDAIAAAGKFVELDLSLCEMNGTVFNPVPNIATGKNRIVSIILPDAAESIPDGNGLNNPFDHFTNLKEVRGDKVLTIGSFAFLELTNLVSVSFPEATSIGWWGAFIGCTSLVNVYFPEVTSITGMAFHGCTSLVSVNFPKATSIGDNAFSDCTSLISVHFPEVTNIGSSVFGGCTSLVNVDFPKVTSIGDGAFRGCTSLESASFPATTDISGNPFSHCTNLTNFIVIGDGQLSAIENGKALVRNNTALIAYPSASGNIVMNNITSIGIRAFSGCTILESVSFPEVMSIAQSAFQGCTNLVSVNFPEVTGIGNQAFRDCTNLVSVNFPKVTSIGIQAFLACINLTEVSFPMATSIDSGAFSNCTSLISVSFPKATSIGQSAFSSCRSLVSVYFPKVTSIGWDAFSGCTSLESVNFPEVTSIDSWAFATTGTHPFTITLGLNAPRLGTTIFSNVTRTVNVFIPQGAILAGARGYTPFDGTSVPITGADQTEHWVNGLRGRGWTAAGAFTNATVGNLRQNVTVTIQYLD
jgi:hypothetical protein